MRLHKVRLAPSSLFLDMASVEAGRSSPLRSRMDHALSGVDGQKLLQSLPIVYAAVDCAFSLC